MIREKLGRLFKRGLPSALLEVALIFVGITSALWFENWNRDRTERADELELLAGLKSNLNENLVQLEENIAYNLGTIAGFETLLARLAERQPYTNDLAGILAELDNWASPYLASSAYETLKDRGLDIVSDASLRDQIVKLFEVRYTALKNDYDRSEWINLELSMLPLMLAHVDERPGEGAVPIDYESLIDNRGFTVAIHRSLNLRTNGVLEYRVALDATRDLIASISQSGVD